MTEVIIAAGDRDKKMWGVLPAILIRHLGAVYSGDSRPGTEHIVIRRPEEAQELCGGRSMVICGGKSALAGLPLQSGAVAVVDSANEAALWRIGRSGLPAITCGLSARDSLTLSSFGPDSAVLAVQRSITCFDCAVIEPQEIPLSLSGETDSFVLMAAASVFLLTGNADQLRNATI